MSNQFRFRWLLAMFCLPAVVPFLVKLQAGTSPLEERHYRVIIDRNPFGLRPPPPLPTNAIPAAPPLQDIFLTGITSFGEERAYFMTKPHPGQSAEYYSLPEGEETNGLEVVDIDLETRSVRVRRGGTESVMTFEANGVKPPVVANGATTAPGKPVPGTRAGSSNPYRAAVEAPGSRSIPIRKLRTSSPPAVRPHVNPDRRSSPEEEVLQMELRRLANPHLNLPPTPLPPGLQ
ncbi:MAG: hypothetical protein U1G07_02070 [Verrucomicrobiota bacterium]